MMKVYIIHAPPHVQYIRASCTSASLHNYIKSYVCFVYFKHAYII